ncbi:hypothetical protein ACJ73_01452 [Blastomyces percursus]|uniref:Uncharacterized protein n=1 Tax=Blastomyces percursus TaxID=1658174 RepID=A0A1J9QF89_9EURO|nr:hypothetical protein ACJ73_01452 [Blastomyces percursus]
MRTGKIGLRPSIRPTTTNAYEVTDCRPCDTSSWNGGAGQKNDIAVAKMSFSVLRAFQAIGASLASCLSDPAMQLQWLWRR